MYTLETNNGLSQGLIKTGVKAGAERAAQYAASFLPGGPITGFVVGTAVGATIGKAFGKSAKAKYRRAKKKGTRMAAGVQADADCLKGEAAYRSREGRGWKYKGKPMNVEFSKAYDLRYWPCVNAIKDCKIVTKNKRKDEHYPPMEKRLHYRKFWDDIYEKWYAECPKTAIVTGQEAVSLGKINPLIIVGIAAIAVMAMRRKAR